MSLYPETQEVLDQQCEEYKDIFSLHQGNSGHAKLLPIDIDTVDHPLLHKDQILYHLNIPNGLKTN